MAGIWLSYSGYKQYKTCPKQYKLRRVDKATPPEEDSRHNAIIGTVVQMVFEDFYNKEIWRRGKDTSPTLLALAEEYFWEFIENEYVDFDHMTCRFANAQEVLDELLDIIPQVLEGIKREKFLGPYAKSEIKMDVRFGQEDFLIGYIDFIIKKQDDQILLLDGKASRHRDKNVDETQLHFYALLFYLRYRRLPDKLGFFFYRFADDPELAMDWIEVDKAKIRDLKRDIEDVLYDIKRRRFEAKPGYKHCQWCLWQSVCGERQAQKQANREKRNSNKPKLVADFGDNATAFIGFDNLKKS